MTKLGDIEKLYKKPKHTREEKMASVQVLIPLYSSSAQKVLLQAGREGREPFGRPKKKGGRLGKTKKNARKTKSFMMIRHKVESKGRKRSFRDKQIKIRDYLTKQKKMR